MALRWAGRYACSSSAARPAPAIASVKAQLTSALEMAATVNESAACLMNETDPSDRQPRAWYVHRYQDAARQQIAQALDAAARAEASLGSTEWQAALRQDVQLALALADSQLARDQLAHDMSERERRQRANEITCND